MDAAASSSSSSAAHLHHPQRRASSVPNLRERPPGSPQLIVLRSPTHPVAGDFIAPRAMLQAVAPAASIPETNAVPEEPNIVAVPPMPRPTMRRRRQAGGGGWRFWWRRTTRFLGYGNGNEARKEVVTLVFNISWNTLQIAVIVLLLILAALTKSTSNAALNEWQACDNPLAAWEILWCIRAAVGFCTAIWSWRLSKQRLSPPDAERAGNGHAGDREVNDVQPSIQDHQAANMATGRTSQTQAGLSSAASARSRRALGRITTLSSFFTVAWFIVAHVFLYTSLSTCRLTSPHLWWACFGVVCIGYIVLLEVFVVGFTVFVLVPIVFLVINIVLVCLGRRPLLPGNDIRPEVPKLPQRLVDRIPLVLYIPPPPDGTPMPPAPAHSYPPRAPSPAPSAHSAASRRSMFKFLRRRRSRRSGKGKGKDIEPGEAEPKTTDDLDLWEDKWEKGEHPFVRLEENRAACAICLMDFEAPRQIRKSIDQVVGGDSADINADVKLVQPHVHSSDDDDDVEDADDLNLRLQDAGDGVQPLRLLTCGHVFHKTCVDPWLVDVSGRCPTCQQPVEIPEIEQGGKRARRGRRDS